MIPMDEGALPPLGLLTTDPEATLRDVATALATTYPAELTALREALAASGVGAAVRRRAGVSRARRCGGSGRTRP